MFIEDGIDLPPAFPPPEDVGEEAKETLVVCSHQCTSYAAEAWLIASSQVQLSRSQSIGPADSICLIYVEQ